MQAVSLTIIPEQEAFGHLHRVLMYDTYSPLAETPHGSVLARGQPGSQELSVKVHGDGFIFPRPYLHIGADETFELGRGQTQGASTQDGLGAVYVDFLKQIHMKTYPHCKKAAFLGRYCMDSPELVKTLPKDMIAGPWEYNPNPTDTTNGFCRCGAGMETWVSPGVNNWRKSIRTSSRAR